MGSLLLLGLLLGHLVIDPTLVPRSILRNGPHLVLRPHTGSPFGSTTSLVVLSLGMSPGFQCSDSKGFTPSTPEQWLRPVTYCSLLVRSSHLGLGSVY